MKAVCWMGVGKMSVETVPDPEILNRRDAIVRITSTCICGSDLHLYNGFIPTMEQGDIMGHEFMGEVVEVGAGVDRDKLKIVFSASVNSGPAVTTPTRITGWQRSCWVPRLAVCSVIPI